MSALAAYAQLPENLLARLEVQPNGCWLWTGGVKSGGYVNYRVNGVSTLGHRFVYETLFGPVPDGLEIDHTCHNGTGCPGGACVHRRCLNPDHLEAVTHRVNTLRGNGPFADRARQTHCIRGHEFNEKNTYVRKNGTRWCLMCKQLRRKEARARGVRH